MLRQLTRGRVAADPETGGGDGAVAGARRRRMSTGWRVVAVLAITQTVGYGVLFYSFSVFLTGMARDLHTSTTVVTGALTVSLLAGAAAAVPVGRRLDRHGGRGLMVCGSGAATLLVFAWSRVTTVAELYAVWAGIGIASAAVLYEAAFPVVISFFDARRRPTALLAVTVVAGFASTIFLPLSGLLADAHGWRTAVAVLAALHGAITVPGHLLIRRPRSPRSGAAGRPAVTDTERSMLIRSALTDPVYWLFGLAFLAQGAAVSAVSVLLVTVLHGLGYPLGFAASVAGLLGVLSVTGRLATTAVTRRAPPAVTAAAVFAVQAAGIALLPFLGRSTGGAIGCVLAFGLGFGVATIARPALLADRYGTAAYATLANALSVPLTASRALAPLAAAALAHRAAGYTPVLLGIAGCCLIGSAGLLAAHRWMRLPTGAFPVTAVEAAG